MSFIESISQEFNNLIKWLGLLTLGFAIGNFVAKILKLNAPITPNAEYILLFCFSFMAMRLLIRYFGHRYLQS